MIKLSELIEKLQSVKEKYGDLYFSGMENDCYGDIDAYPPECIMLGTINGDKDKWNGWVTDLVEGEKPEAFYFSAHSESSVACIPFEELVEKPKPKERFCPISLLEMFANPPALVLGKSMDEMIEDIRKSSDITEGYFRNRRIEKSIYRSPNYISGALTSINQIIKNNRYDFDIANIMIGATGGLDLEEIMKLLMKKPEIPVDFENVIDTSKFAIEIIYGEVTTYKGDFVEGWMNLKVLVIDDTEINKPFQDIKETVEKVLKWFIDCINIIKEKSNE